MSESTMRYDPENDIFFHKHEDGSWSAYFCERHESLEEDEVRPYRGSFEPVGVAHPMIAHPTTGSRGTPRAQLECTASSTTPGCWTGHSAGVP